MTKHDPASSIITHFSPKSPVSEAYRLLRTNLHFSGLDKPIKTILITSAGPSEGKSTTAANLAVALAQAGHKVLIVDADLRKPVQHRIFNLKNLKGLTNFLVDNHEAQDLIQENGVPGVFVLTCGPIPPNPSELLGTTRMVELLDFARDNFDYVIIDTPPAVAVADAAIVAPKVDGVILVVRSKVAKIEMVKQAKELLIKGNGRLIGAVLNAFDYEGGDYNYYYYYYYYYGGDKRKKKKGKKETKVAMW